MRKIGAILGITALVTVVFTPVPAAAFGFHLGRFYFHLPFVGHHYHRHHLASRNEARTGPNDNAEALENCTGLAPGVTNLPIDQIRQTVRPTPDQEAALDNLSSASSQAGEIIKSSCPASVPLTPIGRLDAAEQRLDTTIKAIRMVLLPLERFYETLSDEQRGRFNAMKGSTEGARSPSDMAAMCSQQAGGFIALPVQRIEQVVQPTAQQQSAFDDLKQAAQKVGDQLQSSCPTAVPKSPVARLVTIETRLSAVADAIKEVRPNLKNFYTSLSDDQKARFNMMGPALVPASSQQ
jgi:ABC-type transporter MlaC component